MGMRVIYTVDILRPLIVTEGLIDHYIDLLGKIKLINCPHVQCNDD